MPTTTLQTVLALFGLLNLAQSCPIGQSMSCPVGTTSLSDCTCKTWTGPALNLA